MERPPVEGTRAKSPDPEAKSARDLKAGRCPFNEGFPSEVLPISSRSNIP